MSLVKIEALTAIQVLVPSGQMTATRLVGVKDDETDEWVGSPVEHRGEVTPEELKAALGESLAGALKTIDDLNQTIGRMKSDVMVRDNTIAVMATEYEKSVAGYESAAMALMAERDNAVAELSAYKEKIAPTLEAGAKAIEHLAAMRAIVNKSGA